MVQPRLLVSSFAAVADSLLDDAAELDHPILDAVAGDEARRRRSAQQLHARRRAGRQDDRPPSTDTLLLDADAEQENVIAQIGAGNSLVVTTLPGTGGTQTIVNAIGALASQHKRVLVVEPPSLHARGHPPPPDQVGLPGRARHRRPSAATSSRRSRATSGRSRRRSARSTTRSSGCAGCSSTTAPRCRRSDPDLRRLGHRCARSALEALAMLPYPPGTLVRLDRQTLVGARGGPLARGGGARRRGRPRRVPLRSWRLALVRRVVRPRPTEAQETHDLAKRLHRKDLPQLLERAYGLIGQTQMRPFESIDRARHLPATPRGHP